MKLRAALGVAALALPAAAAAHPSAGDHPGPDNPGPPDLSGLAPDHPGQGDHPTADDHPGGGGNAANPKVTYVFKGTYNEDGSVSVERGNNHVRKADLVGHDVQFNLDKAKLSVADTNGDGAADLSDVPAGDAVVVMARLPKSDPGDQPFEAKAARRPESVSARRRGRLGRRTDVVTGKTPAWRSARSRAGRFVCDQPHWHLGSSLV